MIHRSLGIDDGLVQSQVNAILEDRQGFVWLGTFAGVSRWDGRNFQNFQLREGLAGLDVRAFHETADGDILCAASDGGISVFHDGVFHVTDEDPRLPGSGISDFCLDSEGNLHAASGDGLFIFTGESFDPATTRHELQGIRVSGVERRRAGGLYLSTFGERVLVYEKNSVVPLDPQHVLPSAIIRDVLETPDGDLLISVYKSGVWRWHEGHLHPFAHNSRLKGHDVKSFTRARDGTIYMPTIGGGVGVLRGEDFSLLTRKDGLVNDTSWVVHEGPSGMIYIGTWGGLNLYHPGRFTNFDSSCGLDHDIVTCATELDDGTMAVGTYGGGVSLLDSSQTPGAWKASGRLNAHNGLVDDRVWSLLKAQDGSLYIGTHTGLSRWHEGRLSTIYREEKGPAGRVYALHQRADGTIVLATYGGIFLLADGRVTPLYEESDPGRSTVITVCETRAKELWFGTNFGALRVRDGTVDIPASDPILSTSKIWSIHEARDGTLYFGTDGAGLLIARKGVRAGVPLEVFDVDDGLSENSVLGILETDDGRLFLSTHRGVTILDRSTTPWLVRQLHKSDGLPSDECNQGAVFSDSRGRLWFGTVRGISCYDPYRDRPISTPPFIHILRTQLFEEDLPRSEFGKVAFNHRQNFFKFHFIATNPSSPGNVRYRFRLSGVDPRWVDDTRTMVQYTELPPDHYAFDVMARNEWGVWSQPATLGFVITPPWWSTWWFRIVALLFVVTLAAWIVRARMHRLLAFERLRTKIAADLHDDIGAGLTEISITSHVLSHKLPTDQRDKVAGELRRLDSASSKLVQDMSDIVWLVNPRRDRLQDLFLRLGDTNRAAFEARSIQFHLENMEALSGLRLNMEARQHLFLIFKEAVNNALKYSGCRQLRLGAVRQGRQIRLSLQDDGSGFDPESERSGNGLRNMRDRARQLGGRLEIVSAIRQGTSVTFVGTL